ncbi:MAG: DegT/DnrJ/EryC1/StrS family aminotransferase [Candidatus Omnitrophica bacterium]|nr:DegT/DnrJ/EryC1/StrS family aminotransferase [Candidatus Omnitrophota bacterium]
MSTVPTRAAIRYRATEPLISPKVLENLRRVLEEKYLSPGTWVREFEQRWAKICGVKYAVATSSGTAALHLTLKAAGIGTGDEVIVPAMTCPDTLNAATFVGAKPVIVDIEPVRYGMDPQRMKETITRRTKAVVPVHLYGCVVAPEVFEISRAKGLLVIEDAAEAHGAELNGRKAGALGIAGCFSFRGDKVLGVGTGGMIVTDDARIAERSRYLLGMASPGGFDRYGSTEMGYSYELSNIHAAIGVAQIGMLEETLKTRRAIAGWYDEMLPDEDIEKPAMVPGHVWWRYGVLLKRANPRAVHQTLLERGIETMPPFVPMYRIPMYRDGCDLTQFPVAEDVYRRSLALPISPYLQREDVEEIVTALQHAMKVCP